MESFNWNPCSLVNQMLQGKLVAKSLTIGGKEFDRGGSKKLLKCLTSSEPFGRLES
jgi:hypothetical protein